MAAKKEKGTKKGHQVNVKCDDALYARLSTASQIQQHAEGQLARILIEWALPFYEEARSVEALKFLIRRPQNCTTPNGGEDAQAS